MKRILFVIHDLGQGGAEKVLVNLVNHMDRTKFDISVLALFGGGVNEAFLRPDVRLYHAFSKSIPGNSQWMKLLTPTQLYRWFIKEPYDIVVSYLEGPSARVVSGCPDPNTKLISWIHTAFASRKSAAASFRSYKEAAACYQRFDKIIGVSERVKERFCELLPACPSVEVRYNTIDSALVLRQAKEPVSEVVFDAGQIHLCAVGSLKPVKGFDRLLRVHSRLRKAGLPVHTYVLGRGPEQENLTRQAKELGVADSVTFLGYHTNPYKFVANSNLFVCSSHTEGFSTAATEALIVGTPVCTVDVSGMRELLGSQNEYGIVTENAEEALYQGVYELLTVPGKLDFYRKQAAQRGMHFSKEETVAAVEEMLLHG